ncbi:hypothetical protein E4V99_10255 [Microbacterium sp. dk485]|uniref:hypothetical protein n=1 Tax=Microbacterium sp. dk485 TaxID=2560021 RepID=UPI001073F8B8|nr:hypothetical protein [Microbacterium sp. dk485]TFV85361.1 hypothetical protein E4V99_10255 [Microbacterium sp. dk485]
MDRIHYAGDSILTGTDIARALLECAQALAQVGTAATVDVPTVDDDGEPGRSEILVGPASQLISSSADVPYEEVVDEDLVEQLREKTRNLRRYGTPDAGAVTHEQGDLAAGEWSDYEGI